MDRSVGSPRTRSVVEVRGPGVTPVHALRGIMGNQGKFTKKQSCKTNVFPYISVLINIW